MSLRRLLALLIPVTLTLCAVVILTLPSDAPIVADTSLMLGGSELTDAIGHGVLFSLLSFFWLAMLQATDRSQATPIVCVGLVMLAAVTEIAQVSIPERGASLVDVGANAGGILIGYLVIRHYRSRTNAHEPSRATSMGSR